MEIIQIILLLVGKLTNDRGGYYWEEVPDVNTLEGI